MSGAAQTADMAGGNEEQQVAEGRVPGGPSTRFVSRAAERGGALRRRRGRARVGTRERRAGPRVPQSGAGAVQLRASHLCEVTGG